MFAAEVASTVRGPLRLDPLSEAEAVLIPIRAGNAGMSLPHYVPLEGRKPLLPPGFVLAPCPAGQSPEACDPFVAEVTTLEGGTLLDDPPPNETTVLILVGTGDSGIAAEFHEPLKGVEALLPAVLVAPHPAWQSREASHPLIAEVTTAPTLGTDPLS